MVDIGFHYLTNAEDVTPATIAAGYITPSAIQNKCGEETGYEATKAIDNDIGTHWRHDATELHWIVVDMGATRTVKQVKIYQGSLVAVWRFGYGGTASIYVSDNPAIWGAAVVDDWVCEDGSVGWKESPAFSKSGRYIKIVENADVTQARRTIYEIQVKISPFWQDIDVSAHIPAGSTGVILDIHNTGASTYKADVRKKGSSDDDYDEGEVQANHHLMAVIGVDGSRIFQVMIESTDVKIWLCGYADSKVTFFTNYKDYTPGTLGAFQDIDVSADVSVDATGVVLKLVNASIAAHGLAVRKNGSTDDYHRDSYLYAHAHIYVVMGIDSDKILETWLATTGLKLYLVGYCEPPLDFLTNADALTVPSSGSWEDIDLSGKLREGADGAIFILINKHGFILRQLEIREKGSTDDRHASADIRIDGHIGALMGVDANKVLQGYAEDKNTALFLFYGPTPPPVPPAKPLINKPLVNPTLTNFPLIRTLKKMGVYPALPSGLSTAAPAVKPKNRPHSSIDL